ncbi:hypoxanthine phosphoribosyltransferase [Peptoniphilus sp. GNH]|nr:hypoxanthine phosphoribosyltransferase [Clostridiales bacterium KA00134]UHR02847.1 hypoxanthine phosphoribosyltransferase [Peptoniphilus sp. GNH]
MKDKVERVLFDEATLKKRIETMGHSLDLLYKDEEDLLVISLLKGSFIFAADLIRSMQTKLEVDFMITSSYEDQEKTSGEVKLVKDFSSRIKDRNVLVVDDIVDSGRTMKFVLEHLKKENPKSLRSCVLLDKPSRREVDIDADMVGFEIEDLFVVGYGLNYGDYYRNVPYVFTYKRS